MKNPKIYSDCYQLSIQTFHRTKTFPKALRPTLGRKIEEATLECLLSVRKASVTRSNIRLKHLYNASDSLDEVRTLVQFSKDLKALNVAGFSEITTITKEIGRELGGFIKFEKKNAP
ncbi:four helix bundle protein [Bacteriovoracaceae bacterium]|nr:four helix bundle protein [Bacteriovoracaceae bacterium]